MDNYKVNVLTKALKDMKVSQWNEVKLKGTNTKNINLDEKAVQALINHYKRRK